MPDTCANCGDPVSTAGKTPATGKRFCSRKVECNAAKQRAQYAAKRGGEPGRVEERSCFCCGAAMQSRPWRSTDLELGRWCRKRTCQEQKVHAVNNNSPERIAARAEALRGALRNAAIVECRVCGREDARQAFQHPHKDLAETKRLGHFCNGTGDWEPPMDAARELWLRTS